MECFKCGQDDHLARDCRWTPAELDRPLPRQCARCPRCQVVIYTWDKDVPCEKHRVVAEWRAYYHSDQFVTDAAETRARIEAHKTGKPDKRSEAARQVAESRAARDVI